MEQVVIRKREVEFDFSLLLLYSEVSPSRMAYFVSSATL